MRTVSSDAKSLKHFSNSDAMFWTSVYCRLELHLSSRRSSSECTHWQQCWFWHCGMVKNSCGLHLKVFTALIMSTEKQLKVNEPLLIIKMGKRLGKTSDNSLQNLPAVLLCNSNSVCFALVCSIWTWNSLHWKLLPSREFTIFMATSITSFTSTPTPTKVLGGWCNDNE